MQLLKRSFLLLLTFTLLFSCFEDFDDTFSANVKDFVWRGMNYIYLYKDSQPDLFDDRFDPTTNAYNEFLDSYSSPEELFDDLTVNQDRFSFIVSDYIALQQYLSGVSVSNGMEFNLYYKPGSNSEVYGVVTYVLPNTSASNNGVQRGDLFDKVNETPLYYNSSIDNNFGFFDLNNYTINLATYDTNGTPDDDTDDSVISGSGSITLAKAQYTENPVYKTEILNVDGNNIGYLMYNGFTGDFDSELNSAFSTFQSSNITELVLDLRYNSGGSVNSALWLSSMITGQFTGELFVKEQWNSDWQTYFETQSPESLVNLFTDEMIKYNTDGSIAFQQSINHLNLSRVYVLTTGTTASASELVINGLTPYIDVVQIGDYTTGKYQASVTLYDSDSFGRSGVNPAHLYALQPLVYKSLNADDFTDYDDGLEPDVEFQENAANMGVLGNQNEPLLAAAINHIQGNSRLTSSRYFKMNAPKKIGDSKMNSPVKNRMYTDKKLPVR